MINHFQWTGETAQLVFEHAPLGYFILDKNGVIINVNLTGCTQLMLSKKQLLGKPFSDFLSCKSCQNNFHSHRNHVINTRTLQQVECEVKRKEDSSFFALIESTIVSEGNQKFKFMLSTISDISLQKEQERKLKLSLSREKELNEMKSRFIGITSHEFRTPLATISMSSELLEKYNSPHDEEKKTKHVQRIHSSINRIKEILMDFKSATAIEKGKIRNNPEKFDLIDFTHNLIAEMRSFNGIHTIQHKHKGKYHDVKLDNKLLHTCMANLMVNAFKYSPSGGTIEITTQQLTPGKITITIKDQGLGIPKDEQSHIFTTFFRAKNAVHIQGTGLGLHITQQLVSLMGGSVSFISKENEGTTFSLKFTN